MVASIKMPGLQLTCLNSVKFKGDLAALFIQKRVKNEEALVNYFCYLFCLLALYS